MEFKKRYLIILIGLATLAIAEQADPPSSTGITEVQDKNKDAMELLRRAAHARRYGCLEGNFEVLANIPDEAKSGPFIPGKIYPIWYSGSAGAGSLEKHDQDKDMKGFAIKLKKVEGPSAFDPAKPTTVQDFLLTSRPVPFVDTPEEQRAFMLNPIKFVLTHLDRKDHIDADTGRKIESVWTEAYWSRTPFKMATKNDPNRTAKFMVNPCGSGVDYQPPELEHYKGLSNYYLAEDFIKRAEESAKCFDFYVQFSDTENPERTPIDQDPKKPRVAWPTPYVKIAKITLPANQGVHLDAAREALQLYKKQTGPKDFCESLSYNPWNGHADLTPVGILNAARKDYMHESQKYRAGTAPIILNPDDSAFKVLKAPDFLL